LSINTAESKIIASLIAVSGSGEGGGGSTSIVDLDLTWTGIDLLGSTFIYGKDNDIIFTPNSLADEVCSLTILVTDVTNTEVFKRDFRVRNNQPCKINTGNFPISTNLTVTATVTSDHSVYNKGRGLTKTFKPIKVF